MATAEILGSKRLSLLGSTGSIGEQTLAVAAAAPSRFEVVALGAASASLTVRPTGAASHISGS